MDTVDGEAEIEEAKEASGLLEIETVFDVNCDELIVSPVLLSMAFAIPVNAIVPGDAAV